MAEKIAEACVLGGFSLGLKKASKIAATAAVAAASPSAGARRAARRPVICAKRLSKARLRAESCTNCVGLVHKSRVSARV